MAKISIIIPTPCDTRNTLTLNKLLNSLFKYKSPYHEYDLWIVANNMTGFSNNVNFAIKNSNNDFIMILNDDTEITDKGWEDMMLEGFRQCDVGIVGYSQTAQHNKYSALWCTMIKREVFGKVGLLDEELNVYSQDIALGMLASKAGFKTKFIDLPIKHLWSQTTKRNPQQEELKEQAKKIFFEKYGIDHDTA